MSIESDILKKLQEALKTSCDDALYFSDDETQLIEAEYLLTVNAAKAIKELNKYFGEPYKIHLEHDTKKFATACTPLYGKKINNFSIPKTLIRTRNNTKRSGKIDIALYTTSNGLDKPLCAIEIKGFRPSKAEIIKDLERNAEYFHLTSPTGKSTLPFTVFLALHNYKGVFNNEKERKNLSKLKQLYQMYIDDNTNLSCLSHDIKVMTVRRGVPPDPNCPYIQEHGLQGDEDYHFIGILITSKLRNSY